MRKLLRKLIQSLLFPFFSLFILGVFIFSTLFLPIYLSLEKNIGYWELQKEYWEMGSEMWEALLNWWKS